MFIGHSTLLGLLLALIGVGLMGLATGRMALADQRFVAPRTRRIARTMWRTGLALALVGAVVQMVLVRL